MARNGTCQGENKLSNLVSFRYFDDILLLVESNLLRRRLIAAVRDFWQDTGQCGLLATTYSHPHSNGHHQGRKRKAYRPQAVRDCYGRRMMQSCARHDVLDVLLRAYRGRDTLIYH